ncbi:MAG: stealth family protein [Lysobacterales bacterium]|jgi:hypothetical protein
MTDQPHAPPRIDAVYTWVNGADTDWSWQMERAMKQAVEQARQGKSAIDCRYRRFCDGEELRYSLRALQAHAPWIHHVYLVTNGQRPWWLAEAPAGLTVVRHEEIFPDAGDLPTFNSNAIEMNLHRIPGLSRKFLYLNDDLFLGRACQVTDFLDELGDITYFERIRLDRDLDPTDPGDRACADTLKFVTRAFGGEPLTWMPAHTPQLYDRERIEELEGLFPEEFVRTRGQRFRSARDFVLRIAYAALAAHLDQPNRLLPPSGGDYSLVRLEPQPLQRAREFFHLYRTRPKFFCLNDELAPDFRGAAVGWMMRAFLKARFPRPSRFEADGEET